MSQKSAPPVYQQLSDTLADLIATEFAVGDQFLTERQIAERYGISRTTVNKALSNLVVDGVLEFRKGVGTFVQRRKLNVDLKRLVSFTTKARVAGFSPETVVRSFRATRVADLTLVPPAAVIALLNADDDAPVYETERVRSVDGRIVIYERRALLADRCPGLAAADAAGSLYTVLQERYGIGLDGVAQRIRARTVDAQSAAIIGCDVGDAVLELTGVGHAIGGAPLWYEETYYRGDAYEFVNQVRASGDDSQSSIDTAVGRGPAGEYAWYSW
ncbi:MAG: GntR family transcriptional regulator [Spirochaetaceae bacterium]|nr:MAG: GntR family transcriptional regulator [Spirochaetaceae bacterium]